MEPFKTKRPESQVAQVRRILKAAGLDKHCDRKLQPGTVAIHMVKIQWEDIDRPEQFVKGLLLMAMDLDTGYMKLKVYSRITLPRITNLINLLMDKREDECSKITFTTYEEKTKNGNLLQKACIFRTAPEDFIARLQKRLEEEHHGRVEIIADPPTELAKGHIKIDGKYKGDDKCKEVRMAFRRQVNQYNKRLLQNSAPPKNEPYKPDINS